jgi:predicted outer membrane repeat protein
MRGSATLFSKSLSMVRFVCLLLVLGPGQRRIYGIEVGGAIADQVWGEADSPVRVAENLSIADLTINPGVVVEFAGNYRVTVDGVLRILGTRESPVLLRPAEDNTEGWQGIYFENARPGSEFEWCRLEGARSSAVQLVRSNPTFRHCTFAGNGSTGSGGAIRAELVDGDLSVANCEFQGNHADVSGGAIWATVGTGTLWISDCTFAGNVANPSYVTRDTAGGAVVVRGNSSIARSTFSSNQARAYTIYAASGVYTRGGAVWTDQGHCQMTACKFLDNACTMTAHYQTPDTSYAYGGAVFLQSGSLTLQNCLLAENALSAQRRLVYRGSALYVNTGDCSGVNCTFAANTAHAAIHNNGGSVSLTNSIAYLNYDHVTQISGAAVVSYSDIQGGFEGVSVIDLNPVFDPNHRIRQGSPAIDTGDPNYVAGPNEVDLGGNPRMVGGRVDMGAYEYQGVTGSLHDWNGDGIRSIVGDVPPFVQCVYFGNCPDGVDALAVGDCNGDGILSIVGDVPCFVGCVYFQENCPQ